MPIDTINMPAPDEVVIYNEGMSGPVMFHYAVEGTDCAAIAAGHGFDVKVICLADTLDEDDELFDRYFAHGEVQEVFEAWKPEYPGWELKGKHDTEDGPVAVFLKRRDV